MAAAGLAAAITLALVPAAGPASIASGGTVQVTGKITNTGALAGADVAQLYIHETGTTILQPVRKLAGDSSAGGLHGQFTVR